METSKYFESFFKAIPCYVDVNQVGKVFVQVYVEDNVPVTEANTCMFCRQKKKINCFVIDLANYVKIVKLK